MPKALHVTKRFNGEEFLLLPPAISAQLARFPLVSDLFLCGAGYFPKAETLYRSRPHGYRDFLLIYCAEGQGWYEIQGTRKILNQDHFLLLPAGLPHVYGPHGRNPWTLHWVAFNGANALEYARRLPDNQNVLPVAVEIRPEVLRLFGDVYTLLYEGLSTSYLIYASKMLERILGLLFFHNTALGRSSIGDSDVVTRAIQFMRQQLHRTVELSELAKSANLSITHFSRVFKEKTGYSPIDYFIHLKIQRACQYLTTTNQPIKQIASFVGYDDSAYFSRAFRKVMGTTPEKYRKS
jgi:AraC-like DNA-binding protein